MSTGKTDIEGHFIHACCEYDCLAGNGVIGLEIVDQLEDFDSIICPYGGGSNLLGNASALKQLKPNVKCYACEVDVAAPLYISLRKGVPSKVDEWQRTYIDGMNGKEMFPCMWKMATNLVQDSILVNTDQISSALRLMLNKNKILAEGAGAATVAAAMSEKVPEGKIVCVISGGNIDQKTLMTILNGQTP
ncbi:L-threonine ammonia-lyase-like [Clytia hemisphaerica]|uniref:L-serine deaminase n=1 Tax=Clytia hemisphaerica TaxID=252671 RepID=A0A7M5UGG9_9CNID